jgi:hypothetical protein
MYCYLPTLLCRKEDTDLRESVTTAGGAEGDSVLSIGWQWTDWRTVGAGLKCGEREREPSEAGARERGRYVWKVKGGGSGIDGMGLFVNDEGKGGRKGKRRDGILSVCSGLYRHLALLYPLPTTTVTARPDCCFDLRSSSQNLLARLLLPLFLSHKGNATTASRSVTRSQTRVERSRRPCNNRRLPKFLICDLISHAYAHHDVLNMHTTDFASPFSPAALPDTDIMTLSPFPFFSTITPTAAHHLPACTHMYHVPSTPRSCHLVRLRTDSVLSPNVVCP